MKNVDFVIAWYKTFDLFSLFKWTKITESEVIEQLRYYHH